MACIEQHIQDCLDKGILTTEPIRKYPLRTFNLYAFIKAYSIYCYKPFRYSTRTLNKELGNKYYLTDTGLDILYTFIKSHDLQFNRKIFRYTFARNYDAPAIEHPETHYRLGNFRGEIGDPIKPGSKQGGVVREYLNPIHSRYVDKEFDTLLEARKYLNFRLMYKKPEYFDLYRIRIYHTKYKGKTYTYKGRSKVKVIAKRYVGFSQEAIDKGLKKFQAHIAKQKMEMQYDTTRNIYTTRTEASTSC